MMMMAPLRFNRTGNGTPAVCYVQSADVPNICLPLPRLNLTNGSDAQIIPCCGKKQLSVLLSVEPHRRSLALFTASSASLKRCRTPLPTS